MKVLLGFGSNVGDKKRNINSAYQKLNEIGKIVKKSKMYKTEPVGYMEQEDFINTAVMLETDLKPTELIKKTQQIEKDLGRIKTIENGPRTIDIDILLYEQEIIETKKLQIPHPRFHLRKFNMVCVKEIAPNWIHPKIKKSIKEIFQGLEDTSQVTVI